MATIPGPHGPIPYTRDELGYPSIRARSFEEGTFALGYLHATDRLVQVRLLGLAARGQLLSVLGDKPLPRLVDHSVRALGLCRGLAEQVEACGPEGRRFFANYCKGFNAAARGRRPLLLRLLGLKPSELTPEDVVAAFRFVTYFGLTSLQVSGELLIAELCARGAPKRLLERLLGDLAEGIDWDDVRGLRIPRQLSFFGGSFPGSPLLGSNAFAVAAERSSSGGALLMGEFHMEINRSPPILYATHLELPDDYLCGVTIPGLAWFAAGRTRHVGWSYTYAHADNVDFLMERVKGGRYLAAGEWRPLRRREERVRVRGRPDEVWTFHENDYGVIVNDVTGEEESVVPCIRISGMDQAHRALAAAPRVIACRTVEDLAEVQREVKSVSLEAVMVDSTGAIASIVTGQVDTRPPGWNGVYPRRGWDLAERSLPALPEETRPYVLRPEAGAIASANQGGQGPNVRTWCTLPEPLYRFRRISELLAKRHLHDEASLIAISYDFYDVSARRLLPVWAELLPDEPALQRLSAWAVEQRGERELVRLFHALHEEVCLGLIAEDVGGEVAGRFREWFAVAFYQNEIDALLALETPERLDRESLRRVLRAALPRALDPAISRNVPVKMRFKGLLTQGRTPAWLGFDSREIELPGTPVTPFQCRLAPISGADVVYGPAFHLVFDMSKKGARYNLPGGASESRFGPGFGKGIDHWLRGEMLPLGTGL